MLGNEIKQLQKEKDIKNNVNKINITSIEDLRNHYQKHHAFILSNLSLLNRDSDIALYTDEQKYTIHQCAFCGGKFVLYNRKAKLHKILEETKNTIILDTEHPNTNLIRNIHEISADLKKTKRITYIELQQLLRSTLNVMVEWTDA